MKISDMPNSACNRRIRSTICAWMETSSALTASSQITSLGSHDHRARNAHALVLPAGEFMRIAVDPARLQPDARHHLARLRRAPPCAIIPASACAAVRRWIGRWSCADRGSPADPGKRSGIPCAACGFRSCCIGARSRPHHTTAPSVFGSSFSTARASVDFPQPDSPTTPSVSPSRKREAHAIHRAQRLLLGEQTGLRPENALSGRRTSSNRLGRDRHRHQLGDGRAHRACRCAASHRAASLCSRAAG